MNLDESIIDNIISYNNESKILKEFIINYCKKFINELKTKNPKILSDKNIFNDTIKNEMKYNELRTNINMWEIIPSLFLDDAIEYISGDYSLKYISKYYITYEILINICNRIYNDIIEE